MTADQKSKKPPDGLHITVKLMTEAEREKCEAEAQVSAATPEGDALEKAVRALKGEPPPPAAPPSVEWVEDDTYHETMDSLREVARLAMDSGPWRPIFSRTRAAPAVSECAVTAG